MGYGSDYANAAARIFESEAAARGEATRANGQLWGSALAGIGNTIANYPIEQAKIAEAKQRQQVGQMQIEDIQRQRQAQQLLDSAYQTYGGDIGKLTSTLAASGQGHLIPTVMESHAKYQKALADAAEASDKVEASHANIAAQVGAEMQTYLDEGGPNAVKNAAGHGLVRLSDLQKRGILPDANAQQLASEINPDDEQSVRGLAKRLVDAPKLLEKPVVLPRPGSKLVTPSGQTLAEIPANEPGARNPTEVSLADDAATLGTPQETPTAARSKSALDLLKTSKPATAPNIGSFDDFVIRKYGQNPTSDQIIKARREYGQADDRASQPATIVVQTVDENGRPVTKIVPKVAGASYAKAPSGTTETRLASAQAVNQTGADIITQLKDPKVRGMLGPAMGRYGTLRDFIGNPPPELAELAGSIESYALANMGVHGMRSAQGAEQIKQLLDRKHTPDSLISTIEGLNKFSSHFMENEGRKPGATATASSGITVTAPNGKTYQFKSQADAAAFKARAGIK